MPEKVHRKWNENACEHFYKSSMMEIGFLLKCAYVFMSTRELEILNEHVEMQIRIEEKIVVIVMHDMVFSILLCSILICFNSNR